MPKPGHNETAVRLAALAGDAQIALDKVARGESDAVEGWLAYGSALNEGRALFPGDREFGQWKADNVLSQVGIAPKADEEVAAMWAAANADQLAEAKAASKARTLRGWHDQWKKIEREREKARRDAERKAREGEAKATAEAARREAREQAKVEEAARAAIATATTAAARQEAEDKADAAAEAKATAEKIADDIEAVIKPDPVGAHEENPDAAALRKLFRSMTTEGQEADFIDLHLSLRDRDCEIAALKDEIAKRDSWWKASDEGKNRNRAFAWAEKRIETAKFRMGEYQAEAARLRRQVNAQAAEIKKLRASLEMQEIEL